MIIPEVDIIVVAKNQIGYTRQCVESIFANTTTPFRIIFIDNASTEETPTYLAEAAMRCPSHGAFEILRNEENVGWTRGLNQGIRRSSAQYVIFSNNDVEVFPGAIEEMIAVANADPQVGIVNPNSNEFDVEKKYFVKTKALKGRRIESYHAAGFFMLVKRQVIQRVGEMDEIFSPGYFEEMDYSERSRKAGFICVVALGAYVFHYGSRSFLPEEKKQVWDINEKEFYKRWGADTRFAYVGNGAILKDEHFRQTLARSFLAVIREKKAYAYLFLPFGTKKYFEYLHRRFRIAEVPAGLRWLFLCLKILRVPPRKKIDTLYFSDPAQLTFWQRLGIFRSVKLEQLPDPVSTSDTECIQGQLAGMTELPTHEENSKKSAER
jgi:GT2 family glycosyltransferase